MLRIYQSYMPLWSFSFEVPSSDLYNMFSYTRSNSLVWCYIPGNCAGAWYNWCPDSYKLCLSPWSYQVMTKFIDFACTQIYLSSIYAACFPYATAFKSISFIFSVMFIGLVEQPERVGKDVPSLLWLTMTGLCWKQLWASYFLLDGGSMSFTDWLLLVTSHFVTCRVGD